MKLKWTGAPSLETLGAATTEFSKPFPGATGVAAKVGVSDKGFPSVSAEFNGINTAPEQLPLVTVEEIKEIWSRLGPPLELVLVGISRIWLFPASNGTEADKVAHVSQLEVTVKFIVTAVEAVGLLRLKSMERVDPLPLE